MTSNNYQKANEQIRLSEAQKAQILENVLSADIVPVKKAWHMPVYGWAGMMAGAFALILSNLTRTVSSSPALYV